MSLGHLRIPWRPLRKRPGLLAGRLLTVTVVVTAVTAVFTVANATFLRPLPFPHAERLVRVYLQPPNTTDFSTANPLHPIVFNRFRDRVTLVERLEGIWFAERAVTSDAEPESVAAGRVSTGFFALFGGTPILGRTFTDAEVEADAKLVVLGHGFWLRRYGGDRGVVGKTLLVDREPHEIVGVVNERFQPEFTGSEFWTPLNLRRLESLNSSFVRTVALLRPGVSGAQAAAELNTLLDAARVESPALKGWRANTLDLQRATYATRRSALLVLLAAAAALVLIATANLANLTLADVTGRRAEFAVRAALGGSRADIMLPEVAQAVVLAAAGGAAGLAAGAWIVPPMLALDPAALFSTEQLAVDWRTALCAWAVAAFVMIASVAAPVCRFAGPGLASELAAGAQRVAGGRVARRLRTIMVASQTALALVLLAAGALVVTTFERSARLAPGFDPAHVVTAQLRLAETAYPTHETRAHFVEQVLERVRATPGVVDAATTLNPFNAGFTFVTLVHVEDRPTPDGQPHTVQYRRVTPEYFRALRIPILRGRTFDRRDSPQGTQVAIVSRLFADRFWPGADPIGRRIRRGASPVWSVVVGVVDDVRDVALDQAPVETVYTSQLQSSAAVAPVSLVVRTSGDPASFVPAIKRAVWTIDPGQPLANVVTMEQFLAKTLGPQRFRSLLVAACGVVGLLLAAIGTYGMTARAVSERTKEVGIRLALGGSRGAVWWTVASSGVRAVSAGAAAGVVIALAAGAGLRALLPGLTGHVGWWSAGAAAVLVAAGTVAAMAAARAATMVEPLRALRAD